MIKFATAACVSLLLLNGCIGLPRDFVCSGLYEVTAENYKKNVSDVSLTIEIFPLINRLIFNDKNHGTMSLDSGKLLFWITSDNGQVLYLGERGGMSLEKFGTFDKVNKHLKVTFYDTKYDLNCEFADRRGL